MAATPSFARWLGTPAERAKFREHVAATYEQPATHAFASVADAAFRDMETLLQAPRVAADAAASAGPDTWVEAKRTDDATAYRLGGAGGGVPTTLGVGVVSGLTPAEVFAIVSTFATRKRWDPLFESGRLVRTLDATAMVACATSPSQWPVASREVICVSATRVKPDGSIVNVSRSIDDPSIPVKSGCVRADLWLAGWYLEPTTDNGAPATKVTYISRSDPKGWIPESILSYVAEQTPLCVGRLVRYARKHGAPPFPALLGGRMTQAPEYDLETAEYSLPLELRAGAGRHPSFTELFIGQQRYPYGVDASLEPATAPVNLQAFAVAAAGVKGYMLRLVPRGPAADRVAVTVRLRRRTGPPATVHVGGAGDHDPLPPLEYADLSAAAPERPAPVPAPAPVAAEAPAPPAAAPAAAAAAGDRAAPLPLPLPVWNMTTDTSLARHTARAAELLSRCESIFASVNNKDGAWEDLGSTDLVTLRRQPSGDHPTGILVGSTVIRGFTLSEVLLTIRDDGCRRVWDHEMYDHTEFHGVLAPNAVLMRACLKGKFPVNPRDISVLATFRRRPDGSVIYAAGSIVDPAIPEDRNFVRSWCDFASWLLEDVGTPTSPATRATYINRTNPNGWIPSSILRLVMKGIPMAVANVDKFLHEQGPPPIVERLAGTYVDLPSFDAPTSELAVTYISAPTEAHPSTLLYLPHKRYHNRAAVTVAPAATVRVRLVADSVLEITDVGPNAATAGRRIAIEVKPQRSGAGIAVNGQVLPLATGTPAASPASAPAPAAAAAVAPSGSRTGLAAAMDSGPAGAATVERVVATSPPRARASVAPTDAAEGVASASKAVSPAALAVGSDKPGAGDHDSRVKQLEDRLAALNKRLEYKLAEAADEGVLTGGRRGSSSGPTSSRRVRLVLLILFALTVLWFVRRRRRLQ